MDAPSTSGAAETRGKKRKASGNADSTPVYTKNSKKRRSLSDYTYDMLFLQGDRSDITIRSLGREWHLHKNLLCRSGYFSGMFSGAWKEANESVIEMTAPEGITPEALHTALGSLYKDDVEVSRENVLDVLNAASFLQIDALISKCVDIMKTSISVSTVSGYFNAAAFHCLGEVVKECLLFMQHAFISENAQNLRILFQNASIGFMKHILTGRHFLALNEADLFFKITQFAALRSQPGLDILNMQNILEYVDSFDTTFLRSEPGKPYQTLFEKLKLEQLLKVQESSVMKKLIEAVFPEEDLYRAGYEQWTHMLHLQNGLDHGPRGESTSKEVFNEQCVRCACTCTLGLSSFSSYDREKIDLSHASLLGYNFGVKLNLIISRGIDHKMSLYLSTSTVFPNWTILCRLLIYVVKENTPDVQRSLSKVTEVDLSSKKKYGIVRVPVCLRAKTKAELDQYRVCVGVQVQFVNPLNHNEGEGS